MRPTLEESFDNIP
uniref:Uncharacterized protein n=1 Tax=Lepeophtheirus salmonis TaxID=72036 RepID=A0A0K2T4Z4_LEPSM